MDDPYSVADGSETPVLTPDSSESEESSWHAILPEDYRIGLEEEVLESEIRWEVVLRRATKAWRRPVLEGMFLFLGVNFLAYGIQLAPLAFCGLTGAFVGVIWHFARAGQLLSPIIAMPIQLLCVAFLGDVNVLQFFALPFPLGFIAAFLGSERDTRDW